MVCAWTALVAPASASAGEPVFTQIDAGFNHTLAVKADGSVWAWGSNSQGRLGIGTTGGTYATPIQVPALTNVRYVAAGYSHSLALRSDGTVWAWGDDANGKLGDDAAITNQSSPVQVAGVSNIRHIATGMFHSLAVRSDGTVWAWGNDATGQLGNNATLADQPTPVQVSGMANVQHVAAGMMHSLAVRTDGTAWAWGSDQYGQLGDGAALTTRPTPVQVTGLSSIRQVAAAGSGGSYSLALRSDGTVWTWGDNSYGQLGIAGAPANQPTPLQVTGLTSVREISAGAYHAVAARFDGSAAAWGRDNYGQLGDDAPEVDATTPVPVDIADIRSVSAGAHHTLAVLDDGSMWSWGNDAQGQLGNDEDFLGQPLPVAVPCTSACAFIQVSTSGYHNVALRSDGTVWTWGNDGDGQLGNDASMVSQSVPVQVSGLTGVRQVAAGWTHSMALRNDGTVWTWGDDGEGQLGNDATLQRRTTPVQVPSLTNIRAIAGGGMHSLALHVDGTLWSWGSDLGGQLGNDAALVDQPTPVQVSGLTNVRDIAAGWSHSLAILNDGTGRSWGNDAQGQLGNNASMTNSPIPVTISGLTNLRDVVANGYFSLALRGDGTVASWGQDDRGQLGNNASLTNTATPVTVSGLANIREIDAGWSHGIALRSDGTAWTWGSDAQGQLGNDATLTNQPTPVAVAGIGMARRVFAGELHSIVVLGDGTMRSWGGDGYGQLGDDVPKAGKVTPVVVAVVCDTTPPTPDPSTGSATADSTTQITWTTDAASDVGVGLHATAYGFDGAWQASPTFVRTSLSPNTEYQMSVQARDAVDNRTTASVVSRYTLAEPPSAPTASGGWSAVDGYHVALSWTAPTGGAGSYRVRHDTDAYAAVQATTASTGATLRFLAANTTVTYKICSVNGDGVEASTCTSVVSATTPPAAPTDLSTANHTPSQVTISWTAAAGQTDQRVELFSDAACTTSVSSTTGVSSPHTAAGLLTDRRYFYRLASFSTASSSWGEPTACTALTGNGRTSITTSINAASISLGSLVPGSIGTASTTLTTTTYGSSGYRVSASMDGPMSDGSHEIPMTTSGTVGAPAGAGAGPWTGTGFGMTLLSGENVGAGWAEGTHYAALTPTPTTILETGAAFAADTSNTTTTVIGYRLVVPPATPPGTYDATITYIVTGTP